jgi:hypothetical protein
MWNASAPPVAQQRASCDPDLRDKEHSPVVGSEGSAMSSLPRSGARGVSVTGASEVSSSRQDTEFTPLGVLRVLSCPRCDTWTHDGPCGKAAMTQALPLLPRRGSNRYWHVVCQHLLLACSAEDPACPAVRRHQMPRDRLARTAPDVSGQADAVPIAPVERHGPPHEVRRLRDATAC